MKNRTTCATQADRRGLRIALLPAALAALTTAYAPVSLGGATFKIDDTKWVSIGAGLRTSFTATEEAANAGKWSNDFNLDNIRLYLNGQIHKYFKIEFNTDCQTCGDGGEMRILDAIGKFEFDPMFNIWMGRMLVPAERREMNGPFFSAVYNIFGAGTPFEPADFNTTIRSDGTSAGSFGRDDGATIWGSFFDGRLQYAAGFFRGLRNGANVDDNILYAQRFAYNFLDVEKNPGYYTSGTYYGQGGDILTLGVSNQYQEDGAGTRSDPGNFRGTAVDILFEKPLGDMGVVTVNGEYKNYGIKGYGMASRLAGGGFAMFEGDAYDVSAMYLLPQKVWVGQFQPYVRYVNVDPIKSASRDVYEAGINYIIDGHNAKIMLMYEYGDLLTKGLDYTSTAAGDDVSSIKLGFQLQI
ncbi:hypothetical protein EVC37_13400 [Methylocaldum sp. BRCS4]|jgi:hypothetical protein|uniref:hypothetical protein n=1 Tax=Methylocaldum sp. 14B TaxID=1912213 RepID=UPI00118135C4|nr:hypothetical protein [Methylocaldum sp. 14B]MVF22598.1 hypothetical protein [Methylocaldum sp. BRCS4]